MIKAIYTAIKRALALVINIFKTLVLILVTAVVWFIKAALTGHGKDYPSFFDIWCSISGTPKDSLEIAGLKLLFDKIFMYFCKLIVISVSVFFFFAGLTFLSLFTRPFWYPSYDSADSLNLSAGVLCIVTSVAVYVIANQFRDSQPKYRLLYVLGAMSLFMLALIEDINLATHLIDIIVFVAIALLCVATRFYILRN